MDSTDCPTFRPETYLLCASSATSATQLPPHFHHKVRHFRHNFFHTSSHLPRLAEALWRSGGGSGGWGPEGGIGDSANFRNRLPAVAEVAEAVAPCGGGPRP